MSSEEMVLVKECRTKQQRDERKREDRRSGRTARNRGPWHSNEPTSSRHVASYTCMKLPLSCLILV